MATARRRSPPGAGGQSRPLRAVAAVAVCCGVLARCGGAAAGQNSGSHVGGDGLLPCNATALDRGAVAFFCSGGTSGRTAYTWPENTTEITLDNWNVTTWSWNASFAPATRLSRLSLRRNAVAQLTPDHFGNTSTLLQLNLNQNPIALIDPGTFAGLSALAILRMHINALTAVPPGVFVMPTLIVLNLQDGNITAVAETPSSR